MKAIIFLVSLVLLGTVTYAQLNTQFGLKGGFNISSLKVEDGRDYDSKVGFHVGALAHIHVSTHFAVQPELVYSTQGGKDGNSKLAVNYLNIPVLGQFMLGSGFRLQTGPQLGFLTSAESKTGDVEVEVDDDVETIDLSWSFGGSYLSTSGLGVDVRYNHGLTNINEAGFPEVKNRVFQAGIFYQFMPRYAQRRK
jgi:hypothetical protein